MMNFTSNVVSQPFHVAVFTFDDVLKDANRLKMFFFFFFKCCCFLMFNSLEALSPE